MGLPSLKPKPTSVEIEGIGEVELRRLSFTEIRKFREMQQAELDDDARDPDKPSDAQCYLMACATGADVDEIREEFLEFDPILVRRLVDAVTKLTQDDSGKDEAQALGN